MKNKINNNSEHCPRFEGCLINICPLDPEANLRNKLPDEERCPFTMNKKNRSQKGIRTQMPPHLLEFVPEPNIKMLHRRNQKMWYNLKNGNTRKI